MNALLFPGQGSQFVGMGSELYSNFDVVKKIFKQADEKLNYPISKLILEGPENKLQLTENTQPAILTVSYAIFKVLKDEFEFDFSSFKYFAGHSLGEYTAMSCADYLNFSDTLKLLRMKSKEGTALLVLMSVWVSVVKLKFYLSTTIDNILHPSTTP